MSSWMISRQGSRKPDAMGSSEELPEAHKEQAQNVTTITEEGEPTASQQNTNNISVDEKVQQMKKLTKWDTVKNQPIV